MKAKVQSAGATIELEGTAAEVAEALRAIFPERPAFIPQGVPWDLPVISPTTPIVPTPWPTTTTCKVSP